ncbi:uncharacterized protein LOC119105940 [Pollicipes pollicipes]|uniref:uncharacterized protein LOC119105940 n=1 Tax=Pollicipes pollicipes TaxID=41117 RepID=UPI00188563B5|nr:uncharacterized protein LOC119105940 [Pollicipes pollicipes]
MAGPQAVDLCWLVIISVTLNVTGACSWLLEAVRDRADRCRSGETAEAAPPARDRIKMYRLVDLVLSQALALYALALLLWLPLLQESFLPASAEVARFALPAVCVGIGRHVFCSLRGWRSGRNAMPSVAHAVSAVCHLLFLQTRCNLVFAVLAMLTELGGVFIQATAVVGERRAATAPSWAAGVGVIFAVTFNGLVYLIVLALALARRSPMTMPPLAVGLFFFYITFSFIMNTYSIYLVMAAFFNSVLEARVSSALQRSGPAGLPVQPQALANIRSTLATIEIEGGEPPRTPDGLKFSDGDLLIKNMA